MRIGLQPESVTRPPQWKEGVAKKARPAPGNCDTVLVAPPPSPRYGTRIALCLCDVVSGGKALGPPLLPWEGHVGWAASASEEERRRLREQLRRRSGSVPFFSPSLFLSVPLPFPARVAWSSRRWQQMKEPAGGRPERLPRRRLLLRRFRGRLRGKMGAP